MRLGAYECVLKPDSRARAIFDADRISERHRHRYEVNINYIGTLERCGLVFSGMSPDGLLPEIVEIPDHPWFIGVQFHPGAALAAVRAASAVRLASSAPRSSSRGWCERHAAPHERQWPDCRPIEERGQ